MYFERTQYKDMLDICIQKYGEKSGKKIYEGAEKYMKQFLDEADYRGSDTIKAYMQNNIFPMLAYYMTMLDLQFTKEQAYENVSEEIQKTAILAKEVNKKVGNMPDAYEKFRMGVNDVLAKGFPVEGWEKEVISNNSKEIHFNMKTCLHHEVVSGYGHPEICPAFCEYDTTALSGYLPGIRFERSGTIGEGREVCDFHFKNNIQGHQKR